MAPTDRTQRCRGVRSLRSEHRQLACPLDVHWGAVRHLGRCGYPQRFRRYVEGRAELYREIAVRYLHDGMSPDADLTDDVMERVVDHAKLSHITIGDV